MKKYLFKLILFTVGICFLPSALELNAFGIHNTFFDQYDTYVSGDDIDLQAATTVEGEKKNSNPACIYQILFADSCAPQKWDSILFYNSSIFHNSSAARAYYSRKIFLRNCVLLI